MAFWSLTAAVGVAVLVVAIAFGGWFFLFLAVPIAMVVVWWLTLGSAVGDALPRDAAGIERRAEEERGELLGPGGPDDPDRAGNRPDRLPRA